MQAWIAVNLTANLQDSFTWNTRQIYLWLTAEYKTEKNQLNQAVFWNWIIESKVSIVLLSQALSYAHGPMHLTSLSKRKHFSQCFCYHPQKIQSVSAACQMCKICCMPAAVHQKRPCCRKTHTSEYHGSPTPTHPTYQSIR